MFFPHYFVFFFLEEINSCHAVILRNSWRPAVALGCHQWLNNVWYAFVPAGNYFFFNAFSVKTFEQNEDVYIVLVLPKYHIFSFITALQKLQKMFSRRQIKLNSPWSSISKGFHALALNAWFFFFWRISERMNLLQELHMSPSVVLAVKRWISKSYSQCWKLERVQIHKKCWKTK